MHSRFVATDGSRFAGFVGLLVWLNTFQSLTDVRQDELLSGAVAVALGVIATLIAFVAMHSMVDIPNEPEIVSAESDWVRGAR